MITERYENKSLNGYDETWRANSEARAWEDLARFLIAKKLENCSWVKRIVRSQKYTEKEIIFYTDTGRTVFTIEET